MLAEAEAIELDPDELMLVLSIAERTPTLKPQLVAASDLANKNWPERSGGGPGWTRPPTYTPGWSRRSAWLPSGRPSFTGTTGAAGSP